MKKLVIAMVFVSACSHVGYAPSREPSQEKQDKLPSGFVEISKADPALPTVCTMTMNSTDEREVFYKYLRPLGFQFVELVTSEYQWLKKAGQSQARCDLLVVSGHFGGSFFGDKGKASLEEFENGTCANENVGLFHNPKEVYLFGCNTLASKERDHRTPEEYRAVLLADNFTPAEAEQISSVRYSPLGQDFGDRMARVFANVPRIYGFSSVGPSGKSVRPFLERYFSKTISKYKTAQEYLDAINDSPNTDFLYELKNTPVRQVAGARAVKGDLIPRCFLNDTVVGDQKKYEWIYQILKDKQSRLRYLPEISDYLLKNHRSSTNYKAEQRTINKIAGDRALSEDMRNVLYNLKEFSRFQLQLLPLYQYFGWMSPNEIQDLKYDAFGKFFGLEVTIEAKDHLCSFQYLGTGLVDYEMIKNTKKDELFLDTMICLGSSDLKVQRILAEILQNSSDKVMRIKAAYSLATSKTQDTQIQLLLARALTDSDWFLGMAAEQALRKIRPSSPAVTVEMVKLFGSPDKFKRQRGINLFSESGTTDSEIQNFLFQISQNDSFTDNRELALKALGASRPLNESLQSKLIKILKQSHESDENSRMAVNLLSNSPPRDQGLQKQLVEIMKNGSLLNSYRASGILEKSGPLDMTVINLIVDAMKTGQTVINKENAGLFVLKLLPEDASIHAKIMSYLASDKEPVIRALSAKILGVIKPFQPKFKEALKKAAKGDSSEEVREAARQSLSLL